MALKAKLLSALYRLHGLRYRIYSPISVGVQALLCDGERVLLVKHSYRPGWYLPGGGVKCGETLQQAVQREAREEAGATLSDLAVFGVYSNVKRHLSDHIVVFVCKQFQVSHQHDFEIEESAFFPLSALPGDISSGTKRRLVEYKSGQQGIVYDRW